MFSQKLNEVEISNFYAVRSFWQKKNRKQFMVNERKKFQEKVCFPWSRDVFIFRFFTNFLTDEIVMTKEWLLHFLNLQEKVRFPWSEDVFIGRPASSLRSRLSTWPSSPPALASASTTSKERPPYVTCWNIRT